MMLTTKSRYAVTSIVDIAKISNNEPVNLADISARQNISISYLEQIFAKLKTAGIVSSIKGPGGGYLITKQLDQINIKAIIDAVEEKTRMTQCGNDLNNRCLKNNTKCATHNLWHNLGNHINNYLNNISIKDVIENKL